MQPKDQIATSAQTLWAVDPSHTTVEFAIKNFWITTVKGSIEVSEGTIVRDPDLSRSSVTILLNPASIKRNKQRDAHLRSAVYLDADRYPEIRFESTKVERGTDRDTLRVTGALTIKGASKEIVLDVSEIDRSCSPSGEHVEYFSATTALDRRDFKIDAMPLVLGRRLKVTINLQATRHT
jgi:polyisoprenoid-binding protein YceI